MFKKFGDKLNNKIMNDEGTTMVETLVSFVVLALVLAALYGMVKISSELRMKAVDTANLNNSFNSVIYKNSIGTNDNVRTVSYQGRKLNDQTGKYQTLFFFKLSDETDPRNIDSTISDPNAPLPDSSSQIWSGIRLPHLDATAYICTDPITDTSKEQYEGIVAPKAISFEYNSSF